MKIVLVIGHDQLRQGVYGNTGQSEYQFNDELVNDLVFYKLLPKKHRVFVLYRDPSIKSYTKQMKDLHKRIDKLKAEVSIELHFNSFSRPEANGNEVLYCSKGGKRIADIFDEALDALPNRDRGVKKVTLSDRGGGFCCRGKSLAIILEPFFGARQDAYSYGGMYRMILLNAISNGLASI